MKNNSNDQDLIWHYTTLDVFKKMIFAETGLYATHVRFLNDSSEFRYGWQRIASLAEEYLEKQKMRGRTQKIFISILRH